VYLAVICHSAPLRGDQMNDRICIIEGCSNLGRPRRSTSGNMRRGPRCSKHASGSNRGNPSKRRRNNQRGVKRRKTFKYRMYLKDCCERCGFIPEEICQLTIDHIDGNHDNDDPSNLQTLCHNCHVLKTCKDNHPEIHLQEKINGNTDGY
jgi:5-methylcytosine-specific restriction endonuclease McrA